MSNVAAPKASVAYQPVSGEDLIQHVGIGGNVISWIDGNGRPQGNLFSSQAFNAQTAKTAVTSAVSLFTSAQSILGGGAAGGSLLNQAAKVMTIWAAGVFTSSASAQQLTFSVLIGGVSVLSIQTPSQAVAITNGQWELEAVLLTATTGATGTIEAHGALGLQASATLSTNVPFYADQNTAPSAAINLTSNPLAFDIQIADTSSLTSITMRQAIVEIYN